MAQKNWMIMLCIFLLTAVQSIAVNKAMSPMETLQRSFDKIITILNDPSCKTGQKRLPNAIKYGELRARSLILMKSAAG